MAGRVVRASKFRHVFGQPFKKEECYDDLKVTRTAWDSNYVTANPLFFAVLWEAGGGGSFAVYPWSAPKGRIDPKLPLVAGHKSAVLDLDFHPFNDNIIASVSEDCTAKIWQIPTEGLTNTLLDPVQTLNGHKRKVGTAKFNPVADNLLATSSADFSVKIWDIVSGNASISVDGQHSDLILSVDWNNNGSLLATSSKDKKIRVVDPRGNTVVAEAEGHAGVKGSRLTWLGNKEKIFSCGSTKTSEREYCLWDPRDFSKPLVRSSLDSASGVLMPFYDNDTSVLFLGGKGDGNIRYYEITNDAPYIHPLSEYKSSTPQRGLCLMPKRTVNVSECEIVRMLKLGTKTLEPISFLVPRKSDIFQDDLYPDCASGDASLTASEWLSGKNAEVKTASMQGGFVQKEKSDIKFDKQEEAKPKSEKELLEEVDKLTKRVAYLESELVKKDSKLKELGAQ
jgi:coronin-1B/1C/6